LIALPLVLRLLEELLKLGSKVKDHKALKNKDDARECLNRRYELHDSQLILVPPFLQPQRLSLNCEQ